MATTSDAPARPTISPLRLLLHGVVAFMVIAQIGLSGVFMYYVLNQMTDGRIQLTTPALLFWLFIIALMVAVDAFLVRWIIRMAEGITDLAVMDVTPLGLKVVEMAPGVTFDTLQSKTGVTLLQ